MLRLYCIKYSVSTAKNHNSALVNPIRVCYTVSEDGAAGGKREGTEPWPVCTPQVSLKNICHWLTLWCEPAIQCVRSGKAWRACWVGDETVSEFWTYGLIIKLPTDLLESHGVFSKNQFSEKNISLKGISLGNQAVRYRTGCHTVPYEGSYGVVRGVIRYRTRGFFQIILRFFHSFCWSAVCFFQVDQGREGHS